MFKVEPFKAEYTSGVIDLIQRIQVGEFDLPIQEEQKREWESISDAFQKNKGNYWVALLEGKVIGTIAVVDIGHKALELRDVFLDKAYRGPTGYAKQMLDTVVSWAKGHEVNTIYLGTTLGFKAAHRFYEKSGFREVKRKDLPPFVQPMECDEKFYQLEL